MQIAFLRSAIAAFCISNEHSEKWDDASGGAYPLARPVQELGFMTTKYSPSSRGSEAVKSGQPTETEIAKAAYEIFLEEGSCHGRDVDHWQRAERRLKRPSENVFQSEVMPNEPKMTKATSPQILLGSPSLSSLKSSRVETSVPSARKPEASSKHQAPVL